MCDRGKSSVDNDVAPVVNPFKPAAWSTVFGEQTSPAIPSIAADLPETAAVIGSRRRRLWEIPRHCHCPVIGVCLPIASLRKILDKVLIGKTMAGDYELHVGAVSECAVRNKVSDAMQRELERRCEPEIRRFAKAKSTEDVEALWRDAMEAGDVSAALWAALTHPRCDGVLQETICRDIHMIQHQAGASARADLKRVQALIDENAVLARELGRVQQRSTQWQAERIAEAERLNEQLIKSRGEAIGRETLIAELRAEGQRLRESTPDLQSRNELTQRVMELKARVRALEDELADLRRDSETERLAQQQRMGRQERLAADAAATSDAAIALADAASSTPLSLAARSILCVGGRNSQVPIYRDLVERRGGRFAHHDGGIEDNPHRLDASLAAADLVICQAGCLSHNAYWLVKDHCKRTGKRCVYLESPSVAGFVRGLAQIPIGEAGPN